MPHKIPDVDGLLFHPVPGRCWCEYGGANEDVVVLRGDVIRDVLAENLKAGSAVRK